MRDLKLNPGAKPVKSARVVGDVIGKLHPHGDSAVYAAMVRMAQDFTLRYPLIAGQGNFGSRDGDSAAAYRYCFAAGTRVATEHGLIPIEQIPELGALSKPTEHVLTQRCELPIRMKVASRGGPRPALFWVNSGFQETLRITTRHDYSVRCTPNEPFLVLNSCLKLEWHDASALKPGDLLCLSRKPQLHGEGGMPFVEGFSAKPQTAQLAGLLSGEVKERDGTYVLTFHKRLDAQLANVLAHDVLGRHISSRVEPAGSGFMLMLRGSAVTRFVQGLRPDGRLPQARSLPEALFRAAPVEAAHFCLGLCQSTSGAGSRGSVRFVEFALATRQAAQELKLVLLQLLGVVSGRIHEMAEGGYLVRVAGTQNLHRFFAALKPVEARALATVAEAPTLPSSVSSVLDANGWSAAGYEAALGDYFFEPVRAVETDKPTWVYDLTVPRTHAFVANGFVVHNTECHLVAFLGCGALET